MQSFCACVILSSERTCDSLLAQFEQFFALNFSAFKATLHDRAALFTLRVAKIQLARQVTHARSAAAHSLAAFVAASLMISHARAMSFHPLLAEGPVQRWGILRLRLLGDGNRANRQNDTEYSKQTFS
jgi:hypothetical protein